MSKTKPATKKREGDEAEPFLRCFHCKRDFPRSAPAKENQIIAEHVKVCEKHPMRKLEANFKTVREALVGLVGADTKEELDAIEMGVRALHQGDHDRTVALNAINAIRETL